MKQGQTPFRKKKAADSNIVVPTPVISVNTSFEEEENESSEGSDSESFGQMSRIESAASTAQIPVEANSPFNVFFRTLDLVTKFRVEYMQTLLAEKIPLTNHLVVLKNFNPYFAMGFLKTNMKVYYYITRRYKFTEPFDVQTDQLTDEGYANLVRAFTQKSYLIKNLVKKGYDIKNKHLNIKASDPVMKNFVVEFTSNQPAKNFDAYLRTFGKVPIIIIDCGALIEVQQLKPSNKGTPTTILKLGLSSNPSPTSHGVRK
jgi:hypothetical protein